MAPKPKDDDEDDIDLKEVIRIAKNKPIAFAMAPGKGDGLVFLAHKRKEPAALALKVKKEGGEGAKLVSGTLTVRGSELVIQSNDRVTPTIIKQLKEKLKSQKIMLKPTALGVPDGDEEAGPDAATVKSLHAAMKKHLEDIAKQATALERKLASEANADLSEALKKFQQLMKLVDDKLVSPLEKAAKEADGEKRSRLVKPLGQVLGQVQRAVGDRTFRDLPQNQVAAIPGIPSMQKSLVDLGKALG